MKIQNLPVIKFDPNGAPSDSLMTVNKCETYLWEETRWCNMNPNLYYSYGEQFGWDYVYSLLP